MEGIVRDERGFVIEIPQALREEIHEEVVNLIHNPGKLKMTPDTFRRVHHNAIKYTRGLPVREEYMNALHDETLSLLGPSELFLIGKLQGVRSGRMQTMHIQHAKQAILDSNAQEIEMQPDMSSQAPSLVKRDSTKSQKQEIMEMLDQGMERGAIAKALGIRYQSVYAVWKQRQK